MCTQRTHILVVALLRSNTYFDAIIALKIGNRLVKIKIITIVKIIPCAYVVYFFLIIYLFGDILMSLYIYTYGIQCITYILYSFF